MGDAEAHIALRNCCRATRLLADLKPNPKALISPTPRTTAAVRAWLLHCLHVAFVEEWTWRQRRRRRYPQIHSLCCFFFFKPTVTLRGRYECVSFEEGAWRFQKTRMRTSVPSSWYKWSKWQYNKGCYIIHTHTHTGDMAIYGLKYCINIII